MDTLLSSEDTSIDGDTSEKKADYSQIPQKALPWQLGCLALSEKACRLELPLDVRVFETDQFNCSALGCSRKRYVTHAKIMPQEYARNYCKIAARRLTLYKKIFRNYQDQTNGMLPFKVSHAVIHPKCHNGYTRYAKDLFKALQDVFASAILESDVTKVCLLMQVSEETKIDLSLFGAIAAITERLLYPHSATDHTSNLPEFQMDMVEAADFYSIRKKLDGVKINPPMKALLDSLVAIRRPRSSVK